MAAPEPVEAMLQHSAPARGVAECRVAARAEAARSMRCSASRAHTSTAPSYMRARHGVPPTLASTLPRLATTHAAERKQIGTVHHAYGHLYRRSPASYRSSPRLRSRSQSRSSRSPRRGSSSLWSRRSRPPSRQSCERPPSRRGLSLRLGGLRDRLRLRLRRGGDSACGSLQAQRAARRDGGAPRQCSARPHGAAAHIG